MDTWREVVTYLLRNRKMDPLNHEPLAVSSSFGLVISVGLRANPALEISLRCFPDRAGRDLSFDLHLDRPLALEGLPLNATVGEYNERVRFLRNEVTRISTDNDGPSG